jgi:hypothetical protein
MRTRFLLALAFALAGGPAAAQGLAVSGNVSTLGLGANVAVGLGRFIGLRAAANVQPWELTQEYDDIEFTLNLPSPSYGLLLDVYVVGPLRVTGGAMLFGSDTEIRGRLTSSVDIGGQSYTPEQVGTLSGLFDTSEIAPYVGIGLGRIGGRRGLGFMMDLGVAYQGSPEVQLNASGPVASQPSFQADLAEEERNIEEDAKPFRFYPVLAVGIVIGL